MYSAGIGAIAKVLQLHKLSNGDFTCLTNLSFSPLSTYSDLVLTIPLRL